MALRLFGDRRKSGFELSQRGQGRQPRTEEDRRLTGVPACRNRVADIGSRNRGSEKRIAGPLPEWTSFDAWAGANLEVAISDLYVARRASQDVWPERFE